MRKLSFLFWLCLTAVSLVTLSASKRPQAGSSGGVPVATVVTVLGPKFTPPPAVSKDDIVVREGQDRKEVVDWVPAQGDKAGLQLAIVVDDSGPKDVGKQFEDLGNFIRSLPGSTAVGVFYANNSTITIASQFTPDHEAAAKALRLPLGNSATMSLYQSLMALIAGWPVSGARREMLILADGFDRLRRERYSPDVNTTVDKAQAAGIIFHAIFIASGQFSGVGGQAQRNVHGGQSPGVGSQSQRTSSRIQTVKNVGQGNLNTLTDGTGGYAFFQGFATPISFDPFLTQLDMILKNQYFLGWQTGRSKDSKGELRDFKISIERGGVELRAAPKVFVPGG